MTGRCFSKILVFLVIQYSKGQTNSCGKSSIAVKDSVLMLSDDLVDANTAQEKCSLLGGNLAMTDDPQINTTLTQLMTEKYTTDLQRVYVFYDPITYERYRYSYSSTEIDFWNSTKQLGHLWYFDLYKSNPENTSQPIFFCDGWTGRPNYKWGVTIRKNCQFLENGKPNGWTLRFNLFSHNKTTKGQKEIYNYYGDKHPAVGTNKLRNVNESYRNITQYKGSFQAPSINVCVGARYNTSLRGWYWSDGSSANFSVSNVTTCQQGALHYGIGWEQSSMKCSGEPAYYACQVKLRATANTFKCNASTMVVSWTGLDQIIDNRNIYAQVEIHVLELNKRTYALYADLSTTIGSLSFATDYNIKITAMLNGCLNANISTFIPLRTYRSPPSSCYPSVNATAETFPCNVSIVVVSWTGLDEFISNNDLTAQVEIRVQKLNEAISVPYSENSTTLNNLLHSILYEIQVIVFITGSVTTNITSDLKVTTPVNPPPSCFPEANTNTLSSGMIAGLVIGVLLLVLVIVGLLVMFKRRRDRPSKSDSSQAKVSNHQSSRPSFADRVANSANANMPLDVGANTKSRVTNLFDLYKKNAETGLPFADEFKDILNQCKNYRNAREVSQLPQNAVGNRYKNIYPYDHARVVLQGTGGNDYINAAYIPGYDNERKFIATQGPKKETINNFWWMVWQENSNIIVMLTGLRENGKTKCEQYWPEAGSETTLSPDLKVRSQQEITIGGIVERQFVLSKTMEQRTITQLQYTTWPDHGIPVTTSNMIYLRNMVDDLHETNAPIIVHCSAGVGRTGTYIAMDSLFHELDEKGTVNVPRTVLRMRENRIDMIQNPKQYMYVYKLLMEHESLIKTDKDVTELQSMTSSEINKMQDEEFETLSEWRFGEEWQENHPQLKTYKNTAVKVCDDKSGTSQQLDASYIQEHGSSEFFIAARNPAPGEEENFWKTVVDQRVSLVVDLDQTIQVPINAALKYGDISLSELDVNKSKILSVITVNVSSSTNVFTKRQLIIMEVKGWSDVERPPVEMDFVTLIAAMQRLKAQQKCKCVLVGCSNGSHRTGTFIALVNILERLKAQKRVDVFRTVKDLRDMRPNMVNNKELYKYCYSVVMKYLSDFDTYSNYK